MPYIEINNVSLRYKMLGKSGPWVVLTPGGHLPLESLEPLGRALSNNGHRVLLHDRRNCGYSDVSITRRLDESRRDLAEQEIWIEDLIALLAALDISKVIAGGSSAGCRVSLLLALRRPELVTALLLWMVTGGQHAAQVLGEIYYGQYITMANERGMMAVCQSDFYAERIVQNPGNLERLMQMQVSEFIATMDAWRQYFLEGAELPVIGATITQLKSLRVPTCIVPGSDDIHPRLVAVRLAELLSDAELHYPFEKAQRIELKGQSLETIQAAYQAKLPGIFTRFLEASRNKGVFG